MKRLIAIFLSILLVGVSYASTRALFVSDTVALRSAIASAQPGDTITVEPGIYGGLFNPTVDGTAANPIVLQANGHVEIVGRFFVQGDYWTVRGFDVSDFNDDVIGDGIEVRAAHVLVVNNYVHDECNDNGIGAWNTGPGQVYRGNIVFRSGCFPQYDPAKGRLVHPHNVYTQNSDENGAKIFTGNIFGEEGCTNACNSVVVYGESLNGQTSNFLLDHNIFSTGRSILGGLNASRNIRFSHNTVYGAIIQDGYSAPVQGQFIDNTFISSMFRADRLWVAGGDATPVKPAPNVVTGNSFYGVYITGTRGLEVVAARYTNGQVVVANCAAPFDASDTWDLNTYYGLFSANLCGSGQNRMIGNGWSNWKTHTGYDAHSTSIPAMPNAPLIRLIPNDDDVSLTYVTVYNPTANGTIVLDLPGHQALYEMHDLWGAAVSEGVDHQTLQQFAPWGVYVARQLPEVPTSTPTVTPTATLTSTLTLTNTPTATDTPTSTSTPTATNTATDTPTFTPTFTNTPTITPTPTFTPCALIWRRDEWITVCLADAA